MQQQLLRKIIRKVIEETLQPSDDPSYKWNSDTKEVQSKDGTTLKNSEGQPVKFNSAAEVENYIETNNIKPTVQEMTGTGAVAGYSTPFAFAGDSGDGDKSRKRKIALASMPGGKVVDDIYEEDERRTLEEGRYHNFKNHPDMKNEAKVSYLMAEVHKMLKEVDFLVTMTNRLKEDTGATPRWKRTPKDLVSICEKIKAINSKIKRVKVPQAPIVKEVAPVTTPKVMSKVAPKKVQ